VKVRLLTRWNGYLPNEVVSVSDSRAEMLESEGIGRIIDRPAPVEAPKAEEPEEMKGREVNEPEAKEEEAADEAPKPEVKAKKK